MKVIRYSKYTGEPAGDIDLEDLMSRLADFLLQSGYESPYGIYEMDAEGMAQRHMDELREAMLRALEEGDLLPEEMMQQLIENADLSQNQKLREMIDQIIERMTAEGYISPQPPTVTPPPS